MKPLIEELDLKESTLQIYNSMHRSPYSFFLDSAMSAGRLGRFSFMGDEPFMILSSKGKKIGVDCRGWRKNFTGNPFYVLRELLERYRCDFKTESFPFWGGAVGWFSYDLKDFIEDLPDTARDDAEMPDCRLGFYDCVLVRDNLTGRTFITSSGFPEMGRKRIPRARARMNAFRNRLAGYLKGGALAPERSSPGTGTSTRIDSNFSKKEYIRTVLKAKEYIMSGDIYQVNLSQRLSAPIPADVHPFEIYRALRMINPAPFAAYLNFGDIQIVSASPERYIRIDGKKIETRPIKGTRPRGGDAAEDISLKKELMTSVKDKAENLMIVDLERNDLGRICEYGSVRVSEFIICEEFPTVFHLTSTVEGILKKGVDNIDVFTNCFPGGSITGAPKIKSMEIIEELETVKRGIYTGAIGYICFNGDMDSSIVIRTQVHKDGMLYFGAGGGIVYDSVPEKEYEETFHKVRALIEAIETTERSVAGPVT